MNAPAYQRQRPRDVPPLVPDGSQSPPHDLDAEAVVLSACMLSSSAVLEVREVLRPGDFYSSSNAAIFEAVLAVEAATGKSDVTLVGSWLRDRKRLEQVGGTPYLAQIIDATPALLNVAEHARIVSQSSRRRQMISTCRVIAAEGYGDIGDIEEWLADTVATVGRVAEQYGKTDTLVDISEATDEAWARISARAEQDSDAAPPEIATGFEALDRRMGGGLRRGCQYCLAGLTGHGKTALGLKIATNVARQGFGVVYMSGEMPREQLVERAICQDARIDTGDLSLANLSDEEWSMAAAAVARVQRLPMQIDDRPAQTLANVRTSCRRAIADLRRRHGRPDLELGLVVVDYLQIMKGERRHGDSKETELAGLSQGLLWLAKELHCPVLTLSQLNREGSKKERPQLNDLRGSGSIEQDNFGVIFVYRDDAFERDDAKWTGEAECIVAKMRQGGATGTVRMMFHHASTGFYSVVGEDEAPRKPRKPRRTFRRRDEAEERERYP